jgi:DNA-directed RNA polymerase beta subunit
MPLTPVLTDSESRRTQIRAKALEALRNAFPLPLRDKKIEVSDLKVHEKDFGPNDQKHALLSGGSLFEQVKGTVTLRDAEGKELEKVKNFTLLNLPFFTGRHTFILDGNEYNVSNQLRLKPGVYTRRRGNEELEAAFNLSKGANFRLSLDPAQGHPYIEYGTTAIPLYSVLRKLGVSHGDIATAWGSDVAGQNEKAFEGKHDKHLAKLYEKVTHPSKRTATLPETQLEVVKAAYAATAMDPEVTKETLGKEFSTVTPDALLIASKRLLNVYKNNDETDDRDALRFKTYHSVDDFIKERITLDARALASKVKGRATHKTELRTILPSSPFSAGIRSFLTGSQLSSIPTHINPMEAIDHAVRVTSLGEGGIANERAIPAEARTIHSSHLGILDPIRTSESFRAGIDIRTAMMAHRDEKGNLYTGVKNVKTGKFEMLSAAQMSTSVIAFPKQKMSGMVAAMNKGEVEHVPASKVTHELYDSSQLYSPATNLVPFLESVQGNRGIMGGKVQTQALPLVHREVPWVQSAANKLDAHGKIQYSSWEKELAALALPTSPVAGKVVKIDGQYIYIDPSGKKHAEDFLTEKNSFEKRGGAVKRQKTIDGLCMKIELEPGDVRTGTNDKGEKWEKKMYVAYGHIPKTVGDDGETVDIYLKEDGKYDHVYVVHQRKKDGAHDEDKCMVGFDSKDAAKDAYEKHGPPWGYGSLTEYTWAEFKDDYLSERAREKAAAEKDLIRVPYDSNLPFASKTYLHHDLLVKPGEHVEAEQHLAESNFTRNGTFALGRNMTIGYVPYYGMNSNDAVVISSGAAEKLTSEHMYKEILEVERDAMTGRDIHQQYYGPKYTADQYRKLDANGVVRKGTKVMPHDILIAGVTKGKLSASDALLGNLKKTLVHPYRELVRTWDHDYEGDVIDVHVTDKRVVVTVRTQEPMRVGDKLTGRHGNKGVVSLIVPDEKMLQDESGKPLEVLYTSAGVISRINPAQILETCVAKVAKKTGKPIAVENFSGRDNVQWAKDLLKEHGVKDKETLFDPVSGKKIPGILVGPQYVLRLFKTTETNFAARGTGAYDVNQQPIKGGDEGAKAVGKMEFNALVAHNARNVLRETAAIKSQKNDEFWRAVQLGLPLPPLKSSFAYDKFVGMLHGAGVKVDTRGSISTLSPLTDHDIMKMSAGEVQNEKLVRAKDLAPERGGLFDPAVTGGTTGTRWSHIELAEPVINPIFADPARRLLGLTAKEFEVYHYTNGGAALKKRLNAIDVDGRISELRTAIRKLNGTKLDDAVKQLKFLEALHRQGYKAGDAYVLSKLPVLPPVMRPILPGKSGSELVVGDSNYLYQSAMLHNRSLQRQVEDPVLPPDEHAKLRQNLFNAVGAVVGTHDSDNPKLLKRNVKGLLEHLTGKTTPKSSYFQKKIMKRQQDISGRGTIAPDGSLSMDEIGLPVDMLWGMYGKFVIARLVRRGFGAVAAKEMVEKKHPAAHDALMAELKERPVMVNRAPTLHRYGFVGANPVPVAGKTIRVNPFIELGMNADYDGDTFQIHVPVLPGAVQEVKGMTLSHLLFSDREKDTLMVAPRMEAMLGVHLASKAESSVNGKTHHFKSRADALAAYKRGEISLNAKVEVGP